MAGFFSKLSCPIFTVASTLPTAGMLGGAGVGLHHAYGVNRRRNSGAFAGMGRYIGWGAVGGLGGRAVGMGAQLGLNYGIVRSIPGR